MRGSKIVPVRFPASELLRLDALASRLRLSRSGVVRLALDKMSATAYHTGSQDPRTPAPGGEVESGPPPPVTPSPPASSAADDIDELLREIEDAL